MRIIIQRIKEARVTTQGETVGKVGPGICLFLGIARGDTEEDANYLAEKVTDLRIFEDESGKMNRSVKEVHGGVLVVSEFTLYGDCTKGKRPSFSLAAPPEVAKGLYDHFMKKLLDEGVSVAAGKFQAKMEVSLVNDGPVTFILDSR